jgi:hypothetical protein
MKLTIHHLKARWLVASMVVAVVIGELVASKVADWFSIRVPAVPVAAVCVGLVAAVVALLYDGRE